MNTRLSLTIGLPTFFLLLGGCIIVDGNTGFGGAGGDGNSGNDRITTSSSSSSSSSSGMGGAGGSNQGGAGVGGGGGSAPCVGPDDGILDDKACMALNTQSTGNVCGPNGTDPPPANGTCLRMFQIVNSGAFDLVARCLQNIAGDPTNACDNAQVAACVNLIDANPCPSAEAASLCTQLSQQSCTAPFDTQQCQIDLNPFSTNGLNEMVTCVNKYLNLDCNEAYRQCYDVDIFSY